MLGRTLSGVSREGTEHRRLKTQRKTGGHSLLLTGAGQEGGKRGCDRIVTKRIPKRGEFIGVKRKRKREVKSKRMRKELIATSKRGLKGGASRTQVRKRL